MSSDRADSRQFARLRLPAMYTLVRVRPIGDERFSWTGYIYDISEGGMRFELDTPLDPGTSIEVRAMLPGANHMTFEAAGQVVRLHDDDEIPGPARMGMTFDHFALEEDRSRLADYIGGGAPRLAA